MINPLELIKEIVNEIGYKSKEFTVEMEEDDWIVISARRTQGKWDYIPSAWISALNNDKWKTVPNSTKVECRYFGPSNDRRNKNSQEWMENYFGSNFKMTYVSLG